MNKVDLVIESFVTSDYFIIFLVIVLVVLLVLILLLIKTREDYNELLTKEITFGNNKEKKQEEDNKDDLLYDLEDLMASSKDDVFDENKPLIKQIDMSSVKTLEEKVKDYENIDEENAIISAEELNEKAKQRNEILGTNENQEAIAKYEEEQEKKAIISYEQLLKNASNVTLSYKEEKSKEKSAPKINKVEIEQKEITEAECYLEEEEFLKILKEFRVSL